MKSFISIAMVLVLGLSTIGCKYIRSTEVILAGESTHKTPKTDVPELDQAEWLSFRGPEQSGTATASEIPREFTEANFTWTTELLGRGHSTPVLHRGVLWLTSAIVTATPDSKLYHDDAVGQDMSQASHVDWYIIGVNANSGEVEVEDLILAKDNPQPVQQPHNSYATPTIAIANEKAFCSFGADGLVAYDLVNRDVLWQNDELQINHEVGPGSSPVATSELVVIPYDGYHNQFIAAYDQETGKVVWNTQRSAEDDPTPALNKAFSTPVVFTQDGREKIISIGPHALYQYDAETGQEDWSTLIDETTWSICPVPIVKNGRCYYLTGRGESQLECVDISQGKPKKLWETKAHSCSMPSPVMHDGRIFVPADNGIMLCYDAETGEELWKGRLGGNCASSPIVVADTIFLCNQQGVCFTIHAADELRILSKYDFEEQVFASPIAVADSMFVRTVNKLVRIQAFENSTRLAADSDRDVLER